MKHYCIIDTRNKYVTEKLKYLGFDCISTEKSQNVSEPISYHADVLYLKITENKLLVSSCQKNNIAFLRLQGFVVDTVNLEPGYKTESKLNLIVTDNTVICNPKTSIHIEICEKNKEIINVKQGYTKCSTIVIDSNNFITEDINIYSTLSEAGKNCLIIQKGYVKLKGYDYGFIGGASVYLEHHKLLLFFGDITVHPDYEKILEFCHNIGINTDCISEFELTDLGGAVCLVME